MNLEILTPIRDFQEASYEKYGSYGYCAGYFGSVLADLLESVSEKKRAEIIRQFEISIKSLRN